MLQTGPSADHEATLRTIGTYFGLVVKAADVIAAWQAAAPPAGRAPASARLTIVLGTFGLAHLLGQRRLVGAS
jgi:hypothetical protein